jgi:arylsulfatase
MAIVMRHYHFNWILVLVWFFSGCHQQLDTRPNIILIMADDMGFSDIAPYGGEIETPNLQRLADEGIRFTQFYNAARCCPTRASLLTGLYPHQAGVGHMMEDDGLPGYRGDLSRQSVTIAEVLREAGYATYMSGKWHVTRHMGYWDGDSTRLSKHNWPVQRGFDAFFGTILGAGSFYDPVTLTEDNTPSEPQTDEFYYTDAISDRAAGYIESHHSGAASNKPFFMYVAYTAPHWPLQAPEEDIARYEGRYDKGWDSIREQRRTRQIELGVIDSSWALSPRDSQVPPWEAVPDRQKTWFRRSMEVYAAQVDRMDQGIGRILESLSATGQLDNTLIAFLADNGGCAEVLTPSWRGLFLPKTTRAGDPVSIGNDFSVMPGPEENYQSYGPHWANVSNTPFRRYKHWVHEGGIATPLILHWPATGVRGGVLVEDVGHLVDMMATFVDAAEAHYPDSFNNEVVLPMEGTSLLPIFEQRALPERPIFWEHEGNRAVRSGNWKLVSAFDGDWELYDLASDRSELNNLISERPKIADSLEGLFGEWAQRAQVVPWEALQTRRHQAAN